MNFSSVTILGGIAGTESLLSGIFSIHETEDSIEHIRDQLAILENVELDDPKSDDDEDLSN